MKPTFIALLCMISISALTLQAARYYCLKNGKRTETKYKNHKDCKKECYFQDQSGQKIAGLCLKKK